MKVQRYTWDDALIEAQINGTINDRDLLVALKLSKAINWSPKDARVPGLYWANEEAAAAVGISRSTLYKALRELKRAGFFTLVKGNLVPVIPKSLSETKTAKSLSETAQSLSETPESLSETPKSLLETSKSLSETSKSPSDNPFSEDILSEDILSEDMLSEDMLSKNNPQPQVASDGTLSNQSGDSSTTILDDTNNAAAKPPLESHTIPDPLEIEDANAVSVGERSEPDIVLILLDNDDTLETYVAVPANHVETYKAMQKEPRLTIKHLEQLDTWGNVEACCPRCDAAMRRGNYNQFRCTACNTPKPLIPDTVPVDWINASVDGPIALLNGTRV